MLVGPKVTVLPGESGLNISCARGGGVGGGRASGTCVPGVASRSTYFWGPRTTRHTHSFTTMIRGKRRRLACIC